MLLGGACFAAPAMAEEQSAIPAEQATASAETTQTASAEGAAATAEPTYATEDGEKLICKYSKATGSRLKRVKSCFTRAEWARRSANANRSVNEMQADNQGQQDSR